MEKTKSAIRLSNAIENRIRSNLKSIFKTLIDFSQLYELEKAKLPYHINLIDELQANENAHSRILAQILRYNNNNRYPFLESFLTHLCGFDLQVEKPDVKKVDSCGQIDIPVFDNQYVVIIENKVTGAIDQNTEQGGQLARYIESIHKDYNRPLESIYVVYTPGTTREPHGECWKNKNGESYKDEFNSRYRSISYRDSIYPWLKKEVLSNIDEIDIYLRSAVEQYIDYLEGIFSLRTINKDMNMNLQEFIKKEIGLKDKQPNEAVEILANKKAELENALDQIELLKTEYSKQGLIEQFNIWKEKLQKDYPKLKIVRDYFEEDNTQIKVGVRFSINKMSFTALIEVNRVNEIKGLDKPNIYLGIGIPLVTNTKHQEPESLTQVIRNHELTEPNDWWYGWKYSTVNNSYKQLQDLIDELLPLMDDE